MTIRPVEFHVFGVLIQAMKLKDYHWIEHARIESRMYCFKNMQNLLNCQWEDK